MLILSTTYTYIKLLTEYGINPVVTQLMDEFDWLILPSANPDGYEYSHTMVNQTDIIFIITLVSNYKIM